MNRLAVLVSATDLKQAVQEFLVIKGGIYSEQGRIILGETFTVRFITPDTDEKKLAGLSFTEVHVVGLPIIPVELMERIYSCHRQPVTTERDYRRQFKERCGVCGLTRGAHSAGDTLVALGRNQCPQHEGRMDWPSPPSYFQPTGDYTPVEYGTLARGVHDE